MKTKFFQDVKAEQVRLLYSNTQFSLFASVVVAIVLTIFFWLESNSGLYLVWLLSILLVTGARYFLQRQYERAGQRFSQRTWLWLFLTGTLLAGSAWGMLGLFFLPGTDLTHWFLVMFVLVGLAGGALASLSAYFPAYLFFVMPAFLPMAIQLSIDKLHDRSLMISLIALFVVMTSLLARRSNQYINRTIIMGIERQAMSKNIEEQIETVAAQHERIMETQASLRRVNELFEAAFDTTHVMYAYLDRDFNFMRVNKAYAAMTGKAAEEFVGQNHFALFPDADNQKIFEQVRDSGEGFYIEEKAFEHPILGKTYWDWSLQPLHGHDNDVIGFLLAIIDVTDRKQAQLSSQEKEQYLQSIMDAANEVILTMNANGIIELVNPAAKQVFGYTQDELIGKNISMLMPEAMAKLHQGWVDNYLSESEYHVSGRMLDTQGQRKDGTIFPLSVSVSDKEINGRHVFTSIMRDITEQKNTMDALRVKNTELEYLSAHDSLTGLHNRRTADEILQREWNRAVRAKTAISLMMIDIDYFKKYNDHYGHQAGDNCLQRVASAMKLVLNRPSDLVARYGGEEFIAILPETEQAGALKVAERIRQTIQELELPHEASDKGVVTVSIGVGSARPVRLMNFEKLVSCADGALYQAKKLGRNCVIESGKELSAKTAS